MNGAEQFGGNQKAKDFFGQYGIANLPLKQKYYTKAAALYKDKLSAECEGRSIDLPAPSSELSQPQLPDSVASRSNTGASIASTGFMPDKNRNEEFFARKGMENDSRPADLPPSQGGRFTGFGNSDYQPPQKDDNDFMANLSKGFALFSSKAQELAKVAITQAEVLGKEINENVIKPTSQKIQDPNLRQNISQSFSQFGKSVCRVHIYFECSHGFIRSWKPVIRASVS